MSDIDTIKNRVRKLMAVAGDGVATDGEIENAMRLAAKLIDQHHLNADELQPAEPEAEIRMGRAFGISQARWFTTWESVLARAIERLFGCVKVYIDRETQPIRVNGIALMRGGKVVWGRKVCYYGPVVESTEAAELFTEWSRAIATMGVARWGGCFSGNGAQYCYGFAVALREKAERIDQERRLIQARPIPQLTGTTCTAITLANRYELLREAGSDWLRNECGIKLSTGSPGPGIRAAPRRSEKARPTAARRSSAG